MGCYDWENLKYKDKKEGKVNGAVYFCKKRKTYVRGSDGGCDKHKRDILRKSSEKNEIYNNGKHYYNSEASIVSVVLLLIALIILKILGY